MQRVTDDVEVVRVEAPIEPSFALQLIALWESIFLASYRSSKTILTSAEGAANRHVVFIAKDGDTVIGTSHLVTPVANPTIGGLAEVATHPDYRGRGVAHELSLRARDEFVSHGGKALFLGTVNPAAQIMYQRLGWRRVPGSQVMCWCGEHATPEEFLTDYYHGSGRSEIRSGDARHRIPIIPLIVSDHEERVLDANCGFYSTRYVVQRSCMGLYGRYEAVVDEGGAWFVAGAADGRLVGIASVAWGGAGRVQVGAFCHRRFVDWYGPLLDTALAWAKERYATWADIRLAAIDVDKRSRFEKHGFRVVGPDALFQEIDDVRWPSVRLERSLT